jgi:hypothetical protein
MKAIDNYILERLNPRHLGSTNRFPIDGTLAEIGKFLKKIGFVEVYVTRTADIDQICRVFDDEHVRGFVFCDNNSSIVFTDTSKRIISKDNPIFYMFLYDGKWFYNRCYGETKPIITIPEDEFIKEINKRFGFLI